MSFFLSWLIFSMIYALAALSTNLLVGVIGIFSVSQAAIFGVGAYTVSLLTVGNHVPFPVALLLAMIVCGVLNVLWSLPSLRLWGDYFVVTSFGSQIVASAVFINWSELTGGAAGIPGIPGPKFFGHEIIEPAQFLAFAGIVLLLASVSYWLLMRSPFGRTINAIRQDETAVIAAGKDVLQAKLAVSAISGVYAGLGGALFATFITFIDPTSFDIHVSVLILTMLVVGGARTLAGSIIGPLILMALPQALAYVDVPSTIAGPLRQLLYGALLVAFMLFRPQGIAGKRL
jgi:branched-chain amino acid transport system permease protein